MVTVDHMLAASPKRKLAMLLPLGEWKNQKLLEGSETEVSDKEGNVATIISKVVLTTNHPVTDAISWMLYGYSIADIRRRMELKWPLKNDRVLFLVVEPK